MSAESDSELIGIIVCTYAVVATLRSQIILILQITKRWRIVLQHFLQHNYYYGTIYSKLY